MGKLLLSATLVVCVAVLIYFCDAEILYSSKDSESTNTATADMFQSFSAPSSIESSTNTVNCSDYFVACPRKDIECLGKSIVTFLKQTSKGVPDCNFLAIDPFFSPEIELIYADEGVTYLNTNETVTGLGDQKIIDFKVNTTAKSGVLTTTADVIMASDVVVSFKKLAITLKGHYIGHTTISGTVEYNYDLKEDDRGVKYYDFTLKNVTVNVLNTPVVQLNPELEAIVLNDADVKAILTSEMKAKLRVKTFCGVIEKAYANMIHNVRTLAQFLPASAFFKN